MPVQSRVTPFGEFVATSARGLFMGNRGGRIHDEHKQLGTRRWASKQWICCRLDFNGRRRDVWGGGYTELFFLDEVTAFAAGHRPCFECRRKDAERFAALFAGSDRSSVRPRASGDPERLDRKSAIETLDSRLRGNERILADRASAKTMDTVLHAERLAGRDKRTHVRDLDRLPDGAMTARGGEAFALRGDRLLRWSPAGYADAGPRPRGPAEVLTSPSILRVLAGGYAPVWHPSAG